MDVITCGQRRLRLSIREKALRVGELRMQHMFRQGRGDAGGGMDVSPAFHILTDDEKTDIKERFLRGRQLIDILPYSVPGGLTVTNLICLCGACGRTIPPDQVSIMISEYPAGVTAFDCLGICSSCCTVSQYLYRFRDDGIVQTFDGKTWISMPWSHKPPAWWDLIGRIKGWLGSR